ncbi:MAG: TcpQ domain-containing protein [Boseongicola sp.]|nr:TcpQ domain-containing protein [Boseongicola sp.]
MIRCPDWERLAPQAVLVRGGAGQTNQAFEASAGRTEVTAASAAPAASCSHIVAAGDTLGSVALARLGTSRRWPEIRALNPGVKPDGLRIGSTLKLPCAVADGAGESGAGDPPARAAFLERLRRSLTKHEAPATGAADAPAERATAAAAETAPEEEPALPPPPVWTAAQGEFLADVLTRWGKAAGWTVIVDTTDAWRLAVAFRLQAGFEPAVAELIRGMGHDGVPPRVRLYPNNVLRLGGPL